MWLNRSTCRAGSFTVHFGRTHSKVLLKIHPPMKNADNIYGVVAQAEEENVRTGEKFVVTGLYFRASPSDSGICRQGFDIKPKLADISFLPGQ